MVRILRDRIPLTWRGAFVILLAASALWRVGYGSLDLLIFVIGIAGLILVALAALLTSLAASRLRRRMRDTVTEVGRLESGSLIRTGFQLPGLERWPMVKIHWRWVDPAGVECRPRPRDGRLFEEVVAERRCRVASIHRRFTVHDAFGLSQVSWDDHEPTPLQVLPDVGRLKRMPVVQSVVASEGIPHPSGKPEGDRMEIRRYVPGDSVRHILWKTFARTRQLNVRLPERSIDPGQRTVAYLLTGPDDEAAAAAARAALENGALGTRWLFGADGTHQPTDQLPEALEAIARSGSFRGAASNGHGDISSDGGSSGGGSSGGTHPNGGSSGGDSSGGHSSGGHSSGGLRAFLQHPEVRDEMHCVVFTTARGGTWRQQALDVGRSYGGSLSFVLGTDGIARPEDTPLWHRILFTDEPTPGIPQAELDETLRTLSAAGCSTLVVDRSDGRSYGGQLHGASAAQGGRR